MLIDFLVISYLLIILGIGIYSSRRIQSSSDYLVAGRRLGPFVLAGTLAATCIDGGSTIGVISNAYGKWGSSAIWYNISMGIALILLGFLAPRLRATGMKTVPEFFRRRYGKTAGLLESILTIISMIGLTAGQLKVSASLLEVMAGMDYNTALLITAAIICVYSLLGGFLGVALTDVLQLILVVAGMALAIPFTLHLAGGWQGIQAHLPETSVYTSLTEGIGGWGQILGYILLFFMAFSSGEEVASCCLAADNHRSLRLGTLMSGLLVIVFSVIPVTLGVMIRSLYATDVLSAGAIDAMEQSGRYALPVLAATSMPPLAGAVIFIAILSAAMSSADSALLGAGSVYGNDIYRVFIYPQADGHKTVAVARVAMVFVSIAAFLTAIYCGDVLSTIAFSLAVRAVGSFFPYVIGHLWKRPSSIACIMSLLCGTAAYLLSVWHVIYIPAVNSVIPAVLISGSVFFFFTWLLPAAPEEP